MVLFVVVTDNDENRKALKEMVEGFTATGVKCCIFDSLWPADWDKEPKIDDPRLKGLNLNIIEVKNVLEASLNRDKYLSLDGIHMTEYWHMPAAKEWFKYLAGARKEKL